MCKLQSLWIHKGLCLLCSFYKRSITEFDLSELCESEFSDDHVDASSRTSARHFDKFLERQKSIAGANVTFNDGLRLQINRSIGE